MVASGDLLHLEGIRGLPRTIGLINGTPKQGLRVGRFDSPNLRGLDPHLLLHLRPGAPLALNRMRTRVRNFVSEIFWA